MLILIQVVIVLALIKKTNTITVYTSNGVADGFDVVIGISNSIDKLIK